MVDRYDNSLLNTLKSIEIQLDRIAKAIESSKDCGKDCACKDGK